MRISQERPKIRRPPVWDEPSVGGWTLDEVIARIARAKRIRSADTARVGAPWRRVTKR